VVDETYEQLRARHEQEMRDWVHRALVGGSGSINSAARRAGINAGTLWRLARRFSMEVRDANDL
jgi:transcriptional regulator of acetoin/glycerol metabolism